MEKQYADKERYVLNTDSKKIYTIIGGIIGSSITISIILLIFNRDPNSMSAYGAYAGALANLLLALVTWMYLGEVHGQVKIMAQDGINDQKKVNYEYLSNQMIQLIAPLYFNKNNDVYFGMTGRRLNRINEYDPNAMAYFRFWDHIMGCMHMAIPSLSFALEEYFDAKESYWITRDNHLSDFDYTSEGERLKKKFEDKEKRIIP